jgi:5-methyltetrahydrofolate--homocysteine methyltransferase
METVLSYIDKQVVISPDQPFVIIGERINPTRRKKLAESMASDFWRWKMLAQVEAVRGADECRHPGGAALLSGAVQAVMEFAQTPYVDTANPDAWRQPWRLTLARR